MAINKKLIRFKTLANFESNLAAGNILNTSIVFIQDAKKIWNDGVYYAASEYMHTVTYAELCNLRDTEQLTSGISYRITDYTCTTTQTATKAVDHKFDIIVTAIDEKTLSEEAKAIQHEGDTYFAKSNLQTWKLWYCLDNDVNRFTWVDATNGKGVIYRMIDEMGNDCPYDFKNMMFGWRTLCMPEIEVEYIDDIDNPIKEHCKSKLVAIEYTTASGKGEYMFTYTFTQKKSGNTWIKYTGDSFCVIRDASDATFPVFKVGETINDDTYSRNVTFLSGDLGLSDELYIWWSDEELHGDAIYHYTFNVYDGISSTPSQDYTILCPNYCYGNIITPREGYDGKTTKRYLPYVQFNNTGKKQACYTNTVDAPIIFENINNQLVPCYISFGKGAHNNYLGKGCKNIGAREDFYNNEFALGCNNIYVTDKCQNNKFGIYCRSIQMDDECVYNEFKNQVGTGLEYANIIFDKKCQYNVIGSNTKGLTLEYGCSRNIFEDSNHFITLRAGSDNQGSDYNVFEPYYCGTSETNRKVISSDHKHYSRGTDGDIVEYINSKNQEIKSDLSIIDMNVADLSSEIGIINEHIDELNDSKADIKGVYPEMSVGLAEDLGGRPFYNDEQFSFRPSAGDGNSIKDGMATIESIKGNSVVWNQYFDLDNISQISAYCNKTVNGNSIIIVPTQSVPWMTVSCLTPEIRSNESIHVEYDLLLETEKTINDIFYAGYFTNVNNKTVWLGSTIKASDIANKVHHVSFDITHENAMKSISIGLYEGKYQQTVTKFDSNDKLTVSNIRISQMEDNYVDLLNIDTFAYNKGTLIDMNVNGIKSVGDNLFDKSSWQRGTMSLDGIFTPSSAANRGCILLKCLPNTTYYGVDFSNGFVAAPFWFYDEQMNFIEYKYVGTTSDLNVHNAKGLITSPNNAHYVRILCYEEYVDTCSVSLVHSGYKAENYKYTPYQQDIKDLSFISEAFPEGMRSAGSVYDEIRFNPTKKVWEMVTRIGVVDLADLNIAFTPITNGRPYGLFFADITNMKSGSTLSTNRYVGSGAPAIDKSIFVSNQRIYIVDSSYTDATTFKQAMQEQGVKLYYELAEPIVEEIEGSENLNLDYLVWDFGTEEALSTQPSTLFTGKIEYNFNANDTIRSNKREIDNIHKYVSSLEEEIKQLRSIIEAITIINN